MRPRPSDSDPFDILLLWGVTRVKVLVCLVILALVSLLLALSVLRDGAVAVCRDDRGQVDAVAVAVRRERVHFARTSRRLPQALIVGVRKCGTRALLEMLFLHPGVQKAAGEVHFFDRDENYRRGLDWYRRKMPHSFPGQITIEKSPSYFVTAEVSFNILLNRRF